MANKTQIIDVTRSAIIIDPEAFYGNLMATGQEDSPERTIPIVAFEGYNFLPTSYGYRSYFDVTSTLDIEELTVRCDHILLYQFANYSNILVALCEDGIWTNSGGASGEPWVKRVAHDIPEVGQYLAWTYCVIENVLYTYRQGKPVVNKLTSTSFGPVTFTSITPTFLNMEGQMGIFRANGRLGFWDSANSVAWSSLFDFSDFTPAIETLAANAIFNDVLGRIVHIQGFGSGFLIYSTKNIVGARYSTEGSLLFFAKSIAEQAGIWTAKQVCIGPVDNEQFAYTNTGLKHISADMAVKDIFVGIYDFLRESREPVYLSFLQGRFLFISLIDPAYISGYVSFEVVNVPEITVRLLLNGEELADPEDVPEAIAGIPFQEDLINKVMSGASGGLYAQWRASGSKMVPGRVSSMEPYELDNPFTPDDDAPYLGNLDPLISNADLLTARDTKVLTSPVVIDNQVPSFMDLGWANAPNGPGMSDSGLARFKARQLTEWTEYNTLINALINEILGVPLVFEDIILPTEYASEALAVTSRPANASNIFTDLVDLPYNGTVTEAFVALTWEYKKTYNSALRIRHKQDNIHRTIPMLYGIVEQRWEGAPYIVEPITYYAPPIPNELSFALVGSTVAAGVAPTIPNPYNSLIAYEPSLGVYSYEGESSGDGLTQSQWEVFRDYCIANHISEPPASLSYESTPGSGIWQEYFYVNTVQAEESPTYSWGYKEHSYFIFHMYALDPESTTELPTAHITMAFHVGAFIDGASSIYAWKNVRRENKDLAYSTPSISPVESKASGTQETLDWGVWLEENPDPDFPYSTNEQVLGAPFFSPQEGTILPNLLEVTYPGATFLLQDATTAPIYPVYAGALVYDTGLQKWGKCKADFKTLVDYAPINSNHEQIITYSNFGLDAGVLRSDGSIRLFSALCSDSFIRYGKLGFYRQGFTYPEGIKLYFRKPFTGTIVTDSSLDGRSIHAATHEEFTFVGVGYVEIHPTFAGRWSTISIHGEFDLRSIEFTGRVSGIR